MHLFSQIFRLSGAKFWLRGDIAHCGEILAEWVAETDNAPGQEDAPVSVYLLCVNERQFLDAPLSAFH